MFKYNWCLKKKRIPPPLVSNQVPFYLPLIPNRFLSNFPFTPSPCQLAINPHLSLLYWG